MNALDFVARVTSVGRVAALSATVVDGDRKLELRVTGSHTVVVVGYAGEPYLRFAPAGVAVNDRSPTAIVNKLALPDSVPALDPRATPHWSLLAVTERYAWHDHRLGPRPGQGDRDGVVGTWAIPIVVDGHPDRIAGQLLHSEGPSPLPWLVLLGVALAAAALLSRRTGRAATQIVVACAAAAGAAAALLSIGLSFGPGVPSSTAWVDIPTSAAVAAVAIGLYARVPAAREAIAGLVGLVALLVGLGDASVLVRGFVISGLPTAVIRASAALAVGAGLVAAVTVAVRFLSAPRPAPEAAATRPALAVPQRKGRSR